MTEMKITQKNIDGDTELEVQLKGKQDDRLSILLESIKFLMSQIDLKHICNEDEELFNSASEQLLLSVADLVGYEDYYWVQVPDSEKEYSEDEELIVSKQAKIQLLKHMINKLEDASR
ncbi:hypothetical protein ACQKFO_21585 [Rossellomorea sp. NPDC071047]|jgi:hypothetical protein|uniref:hypothetical protein n=1 Tax=Rossellomorea sp. NPDC071047 TaxID=3390675 RepID=UPI003D090D4F